MTSKLDPQELERLSKEATQGVWRYRPDQYDDWGIVKSPVAPDGFSCVLAQFRDPDALDNETLARHREAKTDPWEANARFVTALVNAYRTGQLVPAQPSGDVVEAVALAILNSDRGMRGLDPLESREHVPDSDGYVTNATAAITTYEAVSGVAKMREDVDRDEAFCDIVWSALKGDHNDLRRQQIILRAFRAALGEKP